MGETDWPTGTGCTDGKRSKERERHELRRAQKCPGALWDTAARGRAIQTVREREGKRGPH